MWRNLRILVTAGPRRCLAIFGIAASVLGLIASFGFFFTWIIPLAAKEQIEKYYAYAVLALCLAFIGFFSVYYSFLSRAELGAATSDHDIEFVTFHKESNPDPTSSATNPTSDIPLFLSERGNYNPQGSGVQHVNINIDSKRYSIIDGDDNFSAIIFKTPNRRNSKKSEMKTLDRRPVQMPQSFLNELRAEGYFLGETSRPHRQVVKTDSKNRN